MTEQYISEKISDTITSSIIKKTNIIERLNNIKGLLQISTGVLIITAAITIINYYHIKQIEPKNDRQIELLKNINDNSATYFKLYQELRTKIDTLLEITIELQSKNNNILSEKYKKKYISTLTSMSDFEKYSNPITIQNKDMCNNVDNEFNELLREYYNVSPCNNVKKATSTGFFSWK